MYVSLVTPKRHLHPQTGSGVEGLDLKFDYNSWAAICGELTQFRVSAPTEPHRLSRYCLYVSRISTHLQIETLFPVQITSPFYCTISLFVLNLKKPRNKHIWTPSDKALAACRFIARGPFKGPFLTQEYIAGNMCTKSFTYHARCGHVEEGIHLVCPNVPLGDHRVLFSPQPSACPALTTVRYVTIYPCFRWECRQQDQLNQDAWLRGGGTVQGYNDFWIFWSAHVRRTWVITGQAPRFPGFGNQPYGSQWPSFWIQQSRVRDLWMVCVDWVSQLLLIWFRVRLSLF